MHNTAYSISTNSISPRYGYQVAVSRDIGVTYLVRLLICEFSKWIEFTWEGVGSLTEFFPFFRTIHHVIGSGSNKKVGGINARRIISTGAVVANVESVWNGSEMNNPTSSVCQLHAAAFTPSSDKAVTPREFPTHPQPTGFRVLNFGKESLREGIRKPLLKVVPTCNLTHGSIVCGCGLLAPAASLL